MLALLPQFQYHWRQLLFAFDLMGDGEATSFTASLEMEKFLCDRLLDQTQTISERFRALFSLRNLKGPGPRNALVLGLLDSLSVSVFACRCIQGLEFLLSKQFRKKKFRTYGSSEVIGQKTWIVNPTYASWSSSFCYQKCLACRICLKLCCNFYSYGL